MVDTAPQPVSDDSEEARAFLQDRVALFWKVTFFIILFGSGLGAVGAVAQRGWDFWLTLAVTAQSGAFWWLCRRGQRSVQFSRLMESAALLFSVTLGATTSRYLLVGVARDRALVDPSSIMMADAFVAMLQLFGTGLLTAIRAALVPSQPRRTLIVSALVGIPPILATSFLLPAAGGALKWRPLDSPIFPWLPGTFVIMWTFVVITCTMISRIIYGLRVEVREARRLGQYVLEKKIGEGGMGQVYRARHGMMRRPSAIKLLRGTQASEMQLRRFEREVQLTARLTHPNTITIFDYGRTNDGVFYYAMELLQGATLQRIVAVKGRQPASRVVRILSQACAALSEAHGIGLIHRDIKPANIMLCFQGGEHDVVKLLDFGLVKELAVDADAKLTGVSTLLGTPQYMAPESILEPGAADARSDIYALGAVAYYLLAGVDVFDGTSVIQLCIQHLHQTPESLVARGVDVPAELDALVLACLDKQPERRPQTTAELRRRLDACTVPPWTAENARAWWSVHQSELERDEAAGAETGRTIEVAAKPQHTLRQASVSASGDSVRSARTK
jgi:eukaryotic-like serine/threonine-protein kinase